MLPYYLHKRFCIYNKYAMMILEPRVKELEKIVDDGAELAISAAEKAVSSEVKVVSAEVVKVVEAQSTACFSWLFEFLRRLRRKSPPVLATSSDSDKVESK